MVVSMPARLVEQYPIETAVQLLLPDGQWYTGKVVAHQHPGVWVQTVDCRRWFVTNTRRIRLFISKREQPR
ncbi:MAG: hypothetical protein Kow0080_03210 [Candidatus Promineifilaceae bacterium]